MLHKQVMIQCPSCFTTMLVRVTPNIQEGKKRIQCSKMAGTSSDCKASFYFWEVMKATW